jgi:CheY-like chemotaxis protein
MERCQGNQVMGNALPKRPTVLIVEDDADLRRLTAAMLEDEQLDIIECESAEAALAVMLMGECEVSMIFADIRLRGVMDGIDLAREVKVRWPLLPAGRNLGSAALCHMLSSVDRTTTTSESEFLLLHSGRLVFRNDRWIHSSIFISSG